MNAKINTYMLSTTIPKYKYISKNPEILKKMLSKYIANTNFSSLIILLYNRKVIDIQLHIGKNNASNITTTFNTAMLKFNFHAKKLIIMYNTIPIIT